MKNKKNKKGEKERGIDCMSGVFAMLVLMGVVAIVIYQEDDSNRFVSGTGSSFQGEAGLTDFAVKSSIATANADKGQQNQQDAQNTQKQKYTKSKSDSNFELTAKKPALAVWPFEHWSKHYVNVTNTGSERLNLSFRVGVKETNVYDISPFPQPNALYLGPGETESIIYFLDPSFRTGLDNNADAGDYKFHVLVDVWEQSETSSAGAPPKSIQSMVMEHEIKVLDTNQKVNLVIQGNAVDENWEGIIGAEIIFEGNLMNYRAVSGAGGYFEAEVYAHKEAGGNPNYYHLKANAVGYKEAHKIVEIGGKEFANGFADAVIMMEGGTVSVFRYNLKKKEGTGLTIWRGDVSSDEKYFVVSQGHVEMDLSQEEIKEKASIILFDANGNKLWQYKAGGEVWGLDLRNDGKYVIASVLGIEKAIILDNKGNLLWEADTGESREAVFSDSGNMFAIGTTEGRLMVYDFESKKMLWEVFLEGQIRKIVFTSEDKYLYAGSGDGNLYKIDANGNIIWKQFVGAWPYTYGIDLSDDEKYVAVMSKLGELSLLNADGDLLWVHDFSGGGEWASISHSISDLTSDLVVAAGAMHKTFGFEGEQLYWGKNSQSGMFSSSNLLLVGGEQTFLYAENGKEIWQYNIGKRVHFAYISNDEKRIILGDSDGYVYFFEKN